MRASHVVVLMTLVVATPAASGAFDPILLAQSGATGGSLAKRGKSTSGTIDPPAPTSQSRTRATTLSVPSPCGRVAGAWSWFLGGDVMINAGGSFAQPASGLTGVWSCQGGQIVMVWSHGFTDKLALSADGSRLSGKNNIGFPVSGARR